jgi:hypothetical protein
MSLLAVSGFLEGPLTEDRKKHSKVSWKRRPHVYRSCRFIQRGEDNKNWKCSGIQFILSTMWNMTKKSMEQNTFRDANMSASQEIRCALRTRFDDYCIQDSPPFVSFLNQTNLVHTLPTYFSNISFNTHTHTNTHIYIYTHTHLYIYRIIVWGEERCVQGFGRKTWGLRDYWGDPSVDGRIILMRIFRKWDVGVWTGLSWLKIYRWRALVSAVMNIPIP